MNSHPTGFSAYNLEHIELVFQLDKNAFAQPFIGLGLKFSSLNAELKARGQHVIAVDELYKHTPVELEKIINEKAKTLEHRLNTESESFSWLKFRNAADVMTAFYKNTRAFLEDYKKGRELAYYVTPDTLSHLPQAETLIVLDDFFNEAHADLTMHHTRLKQLLRLSHDIRIFPLLNDHKNVSTLLGPLVLMLQQEGLGVEIREVPNIWRKNANAMLRVCAKECLI